MREALPVVRTIMLALVVLGATRGARATNLIVNGTFDTDVSSWTASPGNTIAFDPIDEADSAHSGSVKITDNVDAFRDASAIQCVPIDPSVHYLFRASYYFPQGQVPGAVDVFFVGFDSSDCSGSQNSTNVTLEDGLLPAQQWKGIESGNFFAPDPGTHSIQLWLSAYRTTATTDPLVVYFDNVVLEPGNNSGACLPDSSDLCLDHSRFQVYANWRSNSGGGAAVAHHLASDSGAFSFFDPGNLELQVKVLDACAINNEFWVFMSGTTNVEVTVVVYDTVTGQSQVYVNLLGDVFAPILDTEAFATCP